METEDDSSTTTSSSTWTCSSTSDILVTSSSDRSGQLVVRKYFVKNLPNQPGFARRCENHVTLFGVGSSRQLDKERDLDGTAHGLQSVCLIGLVILAGFELAFFRPRRLGRAGLFRFLCGCRAESQDRLGQLVGDLELIWLASRARHRQLCVDGLKVVVDGGQLAVSGDFDHLDVFVFSYQLLHKPVVVAVSERTRVVDLCGLQCGELDSGAVEQVLAVCGRQIRSVQR
ncbi:hypothetical protein OGAPHI_007414 [Ogataea philodendri]|uniref:Uncharacterized protein n=1 Tax=Ogataea philodendri TaxID=1378263 RepID=A0A9P8NWA1_9ASCO|nr:uncharacterized protein OGAPHI_007414 [Ogataea philodendri]KAH3660209.1 hypothetical protein OGAPHI_007414 [Ogataea philodendri]